MTAERNHTTLRRIADVLGLNVEHFLERRHQSEPRHQTKFTKATQAQLEVAELLEAFADVTDIQARRECIEYVRGRQVRSSS